MALLNRQCLQHPHRPAVARCPSCGQSYCRECVVEHDDRLICAGCLERLIDSGAGAARRWSIPILPLAQIVIAGVALWFLFYCAGAVLRRIPAEIHDGIIWSE